MTLKNRVVGITGATGGLGRTVARGMTEGGARLALLGRSTERLEQLASDPPSAEGTRRDLGKVWL